MLKIIFGLSLIINQEHDHAFWPVSAENKRLFDIGCFRGAGDERAETISCIAYLFIGLVHVGDNILFADDDGEVLTDKRQDPFDHWLFRYPAGCILRYAEMRRDNGEVNIGERMWVGLSGDSVPFHTRADGYDLFRRWVLRSDDRWDLTDVADDECDATDRLQRGHECIRWVRFGVRRMHSGQPDKGGLIIFYGCQYLFSAGQCWSSLFFLYHSPKDSLGDSGISRCLYQGFILLLRTKGVFLSVQRPALPAA